jgi:glutathione S-transferase
MLTLFHNNLSVCAQKVRLQLAEKKLDWESRHVDLVHGEHLRPEYLKLNPRGLVPTLVHDGTVVIESTVILEYLEDVFAEPSLRPLSPAARARMRVWAKIPDEGLHTACATISFASAFAEQLSAGLGPTELERRLAGMPDQDRANRQRTLMKEGFAAPFMRSAVRMYENTLDDMNRALEASDWLAGDEFSLAELALSPYLARMDRLGFDRLWQGRRANVAAWFERVRARPSFKVAIDEPQPVDYDDLLRKRGVDLWPKMEPLLRNAAASGRS